MGVGSLTLPSLGRRCKSAPSLAPPGGAPLTWRTTRRIGCTRHLRFPVLRQTGNYPETGLEEINYDLPEADFWPTMGNEDAGSYLKLDSNLRGQGSILTSVALRMYLSKKRSVVSSARTWFSVFEKPCPSPSMTRYSTGAPRLRNASTKRSD